MKYLLVVPLVLFVGCATPTKDVSQVAQTFYNQQRDMKLLDMTGVNSINIAGDDMKISISAPLAPLSMIPSNPSTADTLIRELTGIAKFGTGMYIGGKVLEKAVDTPKTVNPVVVRPEVISGPYSPGAFN